MDEGLDLQFRRGLIPDGGNVLQGQLTGQHHPLGAQVVGRTGSGPVGDAGLGGHVDINLRRELLAGFQHTQICHDEGIHARCGRAPDGVRQAVGLFVGGQGVHGQIDLAAAGMGVDDALGQLFRREVSRGRAHPKFGQAAINGICTVVDGVAQALQIARGGQKFRDL